MYRLLAKDTAEVQSAKETIRLWKAKYPDRPFDLEVLLAVDDTRDYKTIGGSSKHFHFSGRGDQKYEIDYCRRACGCQPCWDRPFNQPMGHGCECPEMRGQWKKGVIQPEAVGAAAEKRSDKKKSNSG